MAESPVYWRIEPVDDFRIPPADKPATCLMTGMVVDNWGGEGLYLSNAAMDSMLHADPDTVMMPRVHYEDMRTLLKECLEFMRWYDMQMLFNSDRSGVHITMRRIEDLMG